MKKFYDTNALLLLQEKAFQEDFVISSITLKELENIKVSSHKDEEVKFLARNVLRLLDQNKDKYKVFIYDMETLSYINGFLMPDTPDTEIIACAKRYNNAFESIVFVTNDLSCKAIAKDVFRLDVESVNIDNQEQYKGYTEKQLSDDEMANFYEHMNENVLSLSTNEYAIIKNQNGEIVDTVKWDGKEYVAVKPKPYKSSMFGTLKPLDEIQRFAMDSVSSNEITVLYGRAGSGKTTIPLHYAMQSLEKGKYNKLYIVYSYDTLKGAKTLGYEKGDHIQKLLYSASIGNILASKFGSMTQVENLIAMGQLDIIPTANIRGVEFEADSIVLCTESQNLDVYTLKTIIQRCKEGCKQIYEGDIIEQKDRNIQTLGIARLIDVFKGNESFGCVKLKNNYRFPLSELADML